MVMLFIENISIPLILIENVTVSFMLIEDMTPLLPLQIEQDGHGTQCQDGTPVVLSYNTVAVERRPTITIRKGAMNMGRQVNKQQDPTICQK